MDNNFEDKDTKTEQANTENERGSELARAKRLKATIICILCGMIAFVVMGMIALFAIPKVESMIDGLFKPEQETETRKPIKFHEIYPDAFNIFEYDEYMELDRNIYFCDPHMGIEEGVLEKDAASYGEVFEIIYKMIKAATNGDWRTYNSYLGEELAPDAGEFTQQQIYEVRLTRYSRRSIEGDDGKIYQEQVYIVEYKINENNGTFRDDIGSNEARRQYYIFTDESGEYKLEQIVNVKYLF